MLQLRINHVALAKALGLILGPFAPWNGLASAPAGVGDVVVTTTSDIGPSTCRELARAGVHVVMLTTRATDRERSRYVSAGAGQYLEIPAPAQVILDAVRAASHELSALEGTS